MSSASVGWTLKTRSSTTKSCSRLERSRARIGHPNGAPSRRRMGTPQPRHLHPQGLDLLLITLLPRLIFPPPRLSRLPLLSSRPPHACYSASRDCNTNDPPEPSESVPDNLLSRTDVTDTETDPPLRAAPAPGRGRPLSELTTTNNTLGLDVGAASTHPPSSTLAPSKAAVWRWPERDPDIDKSVPFLTSTPPLSPHKLKQVSRPMPASTRQQPVSHPTPISSAITTRRSLADLRAPNRHAPDEDDAWNKIRVAQDEQSADRFRKVRLLQRSFDVWRQGHEWIIVRFLLPVPPLGGCAEYCFPPFHSLM